MTLYHGTNADIELIDLTKGMRHKDFGKGFYVTPDKNTAIRMAQKKARLFGGVPTLITYELDPVALQSDLRVKVFPEKACVEKTPLTQYTITTLLLVQLQTMA